MSEERKIVHVEVVLLSASTGTKEYVRALVGNFLRRLTPTASLVTGTRLGPDCFSDDCSMINHVQSIEFEIGDALGSPPIRVCDAEFKIHVFKLDKTGCQVEEMEGNEGVQTATNHILPSDELHHLWESLIYEDNIKEELVNYVSTAMIMADAGIDPNLISWNKVVLLHGPPGTGKTSLCRALAQKISIRLGDRFRLAQLVEINSHSLFSKWFSESGKLVQKMFDQIREMVEDPKNFVCVLIDEVESLSAARKVNDNEPSDAIRVVNALLTQIDAIKRFPNVLIMTTSNVTGTIDLAFVDRADIKRYIGHPSKTAISTMLLGSIEELMTKGVMHRSSLDNLQQSLHQPVVVCNGQQPEKTNPLIEFAGKCNGLSGRTIRKIPFLALVKLVSRHQKLPVSLDQMFTALDVALQDMQSDLKNLANIPQTSS